MAILIVAPLPIAVALVLTSRPDYPDDACYYGAPRASELATDRYLALMTPLAMLALAMVAISALPMRGRWKLLAPAVTTWAIASLVWTDAARPLMVYGANIAVFGLFLGVPIVVLTGVAGRESSWVRAIGWFELLFLLPLLLGLAGLLAQPRCYSSNPPAPIQR
jgi:hypothetical protein